MKMVNKLEEAKKEYEQAKEKYEAVKYEEKRTKTAEEYFNIYFDLDMISDNYKVDPQETFFNIRSRFIQQYDMYKNNDELIGTLKKEYVEMLQSQVHELQEQIDGIKYQYNTQNGK